MQHIINFQSYILTYENTDIQMENEACSDTFIGNV